MVKEYKETDDTDMNQVSLDSEEERFSTTNPMQEPEQEHQVTSTTFNKENRHQQAWCVFFGLSLVLGISLALVAGWYSKAASANMHLAPSLCCGWFESSDHLNKEMQVDFILSVRERNMEVVKKIAHSVSDPRSEMYTKYLTRTEVLNITKPLEEDLKRVTDWLQKHSIEFDVFNNRNVYITTTIFDAEALLSTQFRTLFHHDTLKKIVRAGDYNLPTKVNEVIAGVFGLHGLPLPSQQPLISSSNMDIASITPAVLKRTYSIKNVHPVGTTINRQAVAEFQGQYEKNSDITKFFKRFVPDAQPDDDKVYQFVGSKDRPLPSVEASLDIQYIMGVAPHIKTDFWLFASDDFCKDLMNWTSVILADDDAPLVFSVSYGWQGNLSEVGCPNSEVSVIDDAFAKLATRGITIIFASGDSGSGYDPNGGVCTVVEDIALDGEVADTVPLIDVDSCCNTASLSGEYAGFSFETSKDSVGKCKLYSSVTGNHSQPGTSSATNPLPRLYPSWPASSQWVTAVGGTRFVGHKIGNKEMATDQFGSGGGFSSMFKQPNWQVSAVQHYVNNPPEDPHYPPAGSFDPNGRATPDVSALGEGYQVIIGGSIQSVGGTSASAPAFAGMVALLNEARFQKGMKQLGFLNPFLYQNENCFTDITLGTNAIGRGNGPIKYGFNATAGWDPATGLGTPIFSKLLVAATSGSDKIIHRPSHVHRP